MIDPDPPWKIQVTQTADHDFLSAVAWSKEVFGARQARIYATTLTRAIQALQAGPSLAGVRKRDDIAKGIFSLHIARDGRRGRHFVMFRVVQAKSRQLEILRVLHDAMDLPRHFDQ